MPSKQEVCSGLVGATRTHAKVTETCPKTVIPSWMDRRSDGVPIFLRTSRIVRGKNWNYRFTVTFGDSA